MDNKVVPIKPKNIKQSILDQIELGRGTDITPIGSKNANRLEAERLTPELKMINDKHGLVNSLNGKTMVASMVYNEFYEREIPEFITPEAFIMRYANIDAPEEKERGRVPLGKWWLGHPYRKEYETATFEPDMPPKEYDRDGKTIYNLWEGFSIEPKKGVWKYTIKHIYEILCNKNSGKFKYVMKWLAWCIQNPGEQAEVALIFKGKKGAGKGTILTHFKQLFGRHGIVIANREHLTGKHNAHLQNLVFLFADEAYHPGDREVEGVLKNLITEGSIAVEPKFQNLKITRNCLHIAMATNNEWVVPATEDERRYFINQVDNKYAKGECSDYKRDNYFKRIWKELDGDGLAAMMYDLKAMNLGEFHPRYEVPVTEELRKQIQLSLPKVKTALYYILEEGVFPGEKIDKTYRISLEQLLEYIHNLDTHNYKGISRKNLSNVLTELGLESQRTTYKRFWIFPELGALRTLWNEKVNPTEWDVNATWYIEKSQY